MRSLICIYELILCFQLLVLIFARLHDDDHCTQFAKKQGEAETTQEAMGHEERYRGKDQSLRTSIWLSFHYSSNMRSVNSSFHCVYSTKFFLRQMNRLNVATSRARDAMIVFADSNRIFNGKLRFRKHVSDILRYFLTRDWYTVFKLPKYDSPYFLQVYTNPKMLPQLELGNTFAFEKDNSDHGTGNEWNQGPTTDAPWGMIDASELQPTDVTEEAHLQSLSKRKVEKDCGDLYEVSSNEDSTKRRKSDLSED